MVDSPPIVSETPLQALTGTPTAHGAGVVAGVRLENFGILLGPDDGGVAGGRSHVVKVGAVVAVSDPFQFAGAEAGSGREAHRGSFELREF